MNDAIVVLEFLATLLHVKGVINEREMNEISACCTMEDLDGVLSRLGDGRG
jgi:hypothetical protein